MAAGRGSPVNHGITWNAHPTSESTLDMPRGSRGGSLTHSYRYQTPYKNVYSFYRGKKIVDVFLRKLNKLRQKFGKINLIGCRWCLRFETSWVIRELWKCRLRNRWDTRRRYETNDYLKLIIRCRRISQQMTCRWRKRDDAEGSLRF